MNDPKYSRLELDTVLRSNLASFIQYTAQTVSPGERYRDNWHIACVAWHLEQCLKGNTKRLIITLPPRHLKSICASVAFPAWALGRDPTRKFICVSYSHDLAAKHARDSRAVMESNHYRRIFRATRPSRRKNTELEFVTTKNGSRYATSVGGALTGLGGNFFVIDDPMKAADAHSEAERQRIIQWYENTLYSRLNSKSDDVIILVMQRMHVGDLVGHVLDKEEWEVVNIPAIAEEDTRYRVGDDAYYDRPAGELLHAERENEEALARIRSTLGPYNYVAQYQQCPTPPGGNMIQREWLRHNRENLVVDGDSYIVQSWDTASKAGERNDFSVCTTWVVVGSEYQLIDVYRGRLEYPDLRRRVIALARKYDPDVILIEDAGSGTGLIQDLRQDRGFGWKPIGIRPKGEKIERVATQTAKIEAGDVVLPHEAPWLDDFVAEILAFPNGRHDDQVDSMTQFLKWISKRDYRQGEGERPRSIRPRPTSGRQSRLPGRNLVPRSSYYQTGFI